MSELNLTIRLTDHVGADLRRRWWAGSPHDVVDLVVDALRDHPVAVLDAVAELEATERWPEPACDACHATLNGFTMTVRMAEQLFCSSCAAGRTRYAAGAHLGGDVA